MTEHPHVPAAFINNIRDEGTKDEACDWLQKQWNETCALTAEIESLRAALAEAREVITTLLKTFVGPPSKPTGADIHRAAQWLEKHK